MARRDLSGLVEFCQTERQREVMESIVKHGGPSKASRALAMNIRSVERLLNRVRARAALMGWSPDHNMTHTVPDGYLVKGVSTYYDKDGKPSGQWVKSQQDARRVHELQRLAIEAMCEEITPARPVELGGATEGHLCNLYTLTDSHVGMWASNQDTLSGDWNLEIAERVLTGCFQSMIHASPRAQTCIVNQLGDFLHSDGSGGMMPVTPLHGHVLDQDGRFSKVVQVAIRILRRVIQMALDHHDSVIVLMAEGNHDMASSVWLRAMFKALYENEPRVKVIDSELPYYAYQHGTTMLAFHHGHLKKNDELPILFASQFPRVWGDTTKRYCHTGHRHHLQEKEHSGMTVLQHPTLAARDAYAARGGWVAERQVTSITYSATFGQVARNMVTPEMLG